MLPRLFNISLRLGALGLKLILTLYMGKYLGLSEMGTYGLAAAYVAILIPLLGMRLDYVVSRDIVGMDGVKLAQRMRDQGVFYAINYLFLILLGVAALFANIEHVNPRFLGYTLALSILESIAAVSAGNLVSLHRPILANFLFFTRSAAWVIPVIALGFFMPEYRTADTIFAFWVGGISLSLVITAFVWRTLPWGEAMRTPVEWAFIRESLKKTIPIWLGAVCGAMSVNIDRFVVEHYLGRDYVGINSFYGSFVVAMSALLNSGIFAFGTPRLIAMHKEGKTVEFAQFARTMMIQSSLSGAAIAGCIAVAVPQLGHLMDRPEFAQYASVLWLMLFAAWLRYTAEALYLVMYARHQDRQIWVGNFVLIIAAVLGNLIMVPWLGFIGIGYSAVLTAVILCLWRTYCICHPHYSEVKDLT